MRIKVFCIIILLLNSFIVFSSEGNKYKEYRFSSISRTEGLPHNNVNCILKDAEGFMWYGTRNGLARFDGYEIKTYISHGDSVSLPGNRIQCFAEDTNGNLWIGTYNNGLCIYERDSDKFKHLNKSYYLQGRINNIKVLSDNSIWICTNAGLLVFRESIDTFKVYTHNPDLPGTLNSDLVSDVIETSDGSIYVATESEAILRFDKENDSFEEIWYKRDPSLNINYHKQIIEDKDGILWIAANVHGLCSYNPASGESKIYKQGPNGLSTNILTGSLGLDPSGNIWICTDGGGINIFNPEKEEFYYLTHSDHPESLASDHLYSIYFDNQHFIWIGTFDEGISYYDPEHYKFSSSLYESNDLGFLNEKSVLALHQDLENRIWIGTDGHGLYMISPDGKIREYHKTDRNNSLSTEVITSIAEDKSGNILLGTYSGGFMVLNPKNEQITRYDQGNSQLNQLGSNSVWHILPDSQDRIWLGLLGTGVDLYDPVNRTFTNYGPPSQDPLKKIDFPNIMTILENSEGDIWFGTEGKGIYILDKQTNKVLRFPADETQTITTDGIIKCLYEDRWGHMWIGTEGNGLYRYDAREQKFNSFSMMDGLPSNIVQSITEDGQNNLWMGTSMGLTVLNPNTMEFRTYLKSDGLTGDDFNLNSILKLSDGRILVGSTDGLDIFRPEDIKTNLNLPEVVLTDLMILNKEIYPGDKINNRVILNKTITKTDEITLTHREKTLTVKFAALNFTLPEKCKYEYKLDGFDADWIETGASYRQANYTNLPAGTYFLQIKASNNDGVWSDNVRKLQINVLPPFYDTTWFKGILLVIIGLLGYSVYRYRLNSIRNRFLEKQFEKDKRIMHLEKEKIDAELQKLTFHVLNRNRALIEQKNRLLGLSMKAKESVRIGLQDIISKFDEELNDDKDWKYIEPQLDKVYNNFVSVLKEKHPELNITEVKIAAYVRMNMSTKEISELMHKTVRAIENDRYRLRKKIGLDTNDSLSSYLMDLQ